MLTLFCIVWSRNTFDFKISRDHGKNSNKRRFYESVDDQSLSWGVAKKSMDNRIHAAKGYVMYSTL